MKKSILTALAFLLISVTGYAQTPAYISENALIDGKTILKADLMGLGIRNYGFSAERIINKKISLNLGLHIMPKGGVPMLSFLDKYVPGVLENFDYDNIKNMQINSLAFTPELRIYTGRHGYGRGFYLAPYYNYFTFDLNNLKIEEEIDGRIESTTLAGGINTHSGGIMMGCQWMVGKKKNFIIDWGIIGIHAGTSSGNLDGTLSRPLDPDEQQDVKNALDENLNSIPLFKFTTEVDANSAKVTEKGPWAFLKGSLSIGIRL